MIKTSDLLFLYYHPKSGFVLTKEPIHPDSWNIEVLPEDGRYRHDLLGEKGNRVITLINLIGEHHEWPTEKSDWLVGLYDQTDPSHVKNIFVHSQEVARHFHPA